MTFFRAIAVLATLAVVTGCASLSEEQCLSGDWAGIGQSDGAAGLVAEAQFARHVKACADAGITPDRAAWQSGYARGLQSYCTPQKGLDEGLAGRRYRNLCPPASEPGFLRGYRIGADDHAARQEVRKLESDIARLTSRNSQIMAALPAGNDATLRTELRNNRAEILRLQLELGFARAEAARSRRAVSEFRAG